MVSSDNLAQSDMTIFGICAKAIDVEKHTAWLVFASGMDVAATRP
ncbi:MAG: hypothetical protein N838_03280 [Thiohalocapsa sp. PB-PSB1]|jgi:hypothetical protein|nr:MAG: hypothetical protein N838_03280 [Thiohalocapsa sp. PB-PSB1]